MGNLEMLSKKNEVKKMEEKNDNKKYMNGKCGKIWIYIYFSFNSFFFIFISKPSN
jgi:hypothetical protein